MDFGDILDRWERGGGREGPPRDAADRDKGSAPDRDARDSGEGADPAADETGEEGSPSAAHRSLDLWLRRYGVDDKDLAAEDPPAAALRAAQSRRLAALKPQGRIDLHGMSAEEAARELEDFLARSARAGLEKVLVVHGKGNHSAGEPVLGKVARRIIEASPSAGRFGEAAREQGGSGALWVLLRREG